MEGVIVDISARKQKPLYKPQRQSYGLYLRHPDPLFVLTAEGQVIEAVEISPPVI